MKENETHKTVTSETHIKATASLQRQIDEELKCTGDQKAIADLLADELKKGKKKDNENTKRKD